MKKIFICSFIILLLVEGCKKDSPKQATLLNTKWALAYVKSTKSNSVTYYPSDESKKIIIDFTDSLNIVSFSGICNIGEGKYSFSTTGTLKITEMVTTKIGCKDVEWESYTVQSMQEAYSYSVNGNSLVIYTKGDYYLYFIGN